MKKKGRAWHLFVVALLILGFAYTAFFGITSQYGDTKTTYIKGAEDIRFGIDIRGGVDVTFMPADGYDATDEQMAAAETVIQQRLVNLSITDSEVYVDYNKDRIIVRFPWKEGEADFNPEAAIAEIGTTAHMTFRKGPNPDGELILEGADVAKATPGMDDKNQFYVALEMKDSGKQAFADATAELSSSSPKGVISIWLDDQNISTATVNETIAEGKATITGAFTSDEVITLSNQINSGALPFALSAESYSTISPSLGAKSLDAMVMAGVIACVLVLVYMVAVYRLPGFLACLALLGQVAATLAAVSGYLPIFNSFTLTLPGIAGIILAIGMGVDANVITAERIKEELKSGKTLDGAISAGFARGLSPIIDGNVTIVIVAIVLMGAFGPTDGVFAKLLKPIFFAFGPSTAGTIYSFGYTLLVGVLLNFLFGVLATRLMVRGASRIKGLRNPWLFGGDKHSEDIVPTDAVKYQAKYQIIGKRKIFMTISALIIVAILVCSAVFGVAMDIQFKGGAMITLSYEGELDQSAAQAAIEGVLGKVSLQTGENVATGDNALTVTMPGAETVTTEELEAAMAALDTSCPDNHFEQLSMSNVNPTIGNEFLKKSLVAVVAAVVLIMAYIALRFRKIGGLPAGVMAVIALINDLIVVFGVFVILGIPLNGNFIAAMLTILGYSINDTVVMYDRIRENESLFGNKMPFEQLVNLSINQSLRRSINTTVTTCLALATVCVVAVVFGLSSIFTFALPLMVGMISGVYTSLCITTSLWTEWDGRKSKKTGKKAA